jgi:hypothetical protein
LPDLTRALALDNGYYRESIYLLRAACLWQLCRLDEALADCAKVTDECWFHHFAGFISLNRGIAPSASRRGENHPEGEFRSSAATRVQERTALSSSPHANASSMYPREHRAPGSPRAPARAARACPSGEEPAKTGRPPP